MSTSTPAFIVDTVSHSSPRKAGRDDSREAVILLHGFPDTPATWNPLVAHLKNFDYKCYAPWLPGYNIMSPELEDSALSLHKVVASLHNLVESTLRKHDKTKLHIIGHDWGSIIAQQYTITYPENVQSLSLLVVPCGLLQNVVFDCPAQTRLSLYMVLFQVPILPEYLVSERDARNDLIRFTRSRF